MSKIVRFTDEACEWAECLVGGFSLVMLACALLLLDTGCAFVEGGNGKPRVPDGWCESHFCIDEVTAFTPAGEGLYGITTRSLERFSAATGRELRTDQNAGIPIVWRETITGENGLDDCGGTLAEGFDGIGVWTQAIYLDPNPPLGCPAPETTLMHELIHAMAPEAKHVDVDSLFYKSTGALERKLDEPALERLCEWFDCQAFVPER